MVLDDVPGRSDGLRGELLQHIVEPGLLACDVTCTKDRFDLKKPFNRPHGPKGGDFYYGIYQVLRSWLLCICREKFCAEARSLLGEVDITGLLLLMIITYY